MFLRQWSIFNLLIQSPSAKGSPYFSRIQIPYNGQRSKAQLNELLFFFSAHRMIRRQTRARVLQNYKVSQKKFVKLKRVTSFFARQADFFFTWKTKFNYVLDLSRAQEASVLQEKSLSISSPRSESNFPKQLMGLQAEMKALALLHELESLSLSESSKCGANWQMLLLLSFFFFFFRETISRFDLWPSKICWQKRRTFWLKNILENESKSYFCSFFS